MTNMTKLDNKHFLSIEDLLNLDYEVESDADSFDKPVGKTLDDDTVSERYPHFDTDDDAPDPLIIHKCERIELERDEFGFIVGGGTKEIVETDYYLFGTKNPLGSANSRKFDTYEEAFKAAIEHICTDSKDCE
jgi:hypothetical protein